MQSPLVIVGSTILQIVDMFALNNYKLSAISNIGPGIMAYTDLSVMNNNYDVYSVHVQVMRYYTLCGTCTVELPNNGHIGSGHFVLYMEVVPVYRSGDKIDP